MAKHHSIIRDELVRGIAEMESADVPVDGTVAELLRASIVLGMNVVEPRRLAGVLRIWADAIDRDNPQLEDIEPIGSA